MADNFTWTSAEDSNFVTELVDTIKPHFLNNRIPGPFPVVLKLLAHSSSCALVAGQPRAKTAAEDQHQQENPGDRVNPKKN